MADLDQQLSDSVADGRITTGDAEQAATFREFLRETPHRFVGRADLEAWCARWMPYLTGESDGPESQEESEGVTDGG